MKQQLSTGEGRNVKARTLVQLWKSSPKCFLTKLKSNANGHRGNFDLVWKLQFTLRFPHPPDFLSVPQPGTAFLDNFSAVICFYCCCGPLKCDKVAIVAAIS